MDSITEKKCSKCGETKPVTEFYKDRKLPSGLRIYCKECDKQCAHMWHKDNPEKHYEINKKWLKENPERAKDRTDKYRIENKEVIKEKAHKRYLKNQDRERKSARLWQLLNPERVKENLKRWFSNNPGKNKEYSSARRARLAGNGMEGFEVLRNGKTIIENGLIFYRMNADLKDEFALFKKRYSVELEILRKTKADASARNSKDKRRSAISNNGNVTAQEWRVLCDKYENMCLCCGRRDVNLTIDHVMPLKLGGSNTIDNIQPLCRSCNSRKGAKNIDYRK